MADVSAAPIRKPSLLRKDASVPLLHEQTGSVTHVDILPASKPISQSIQPVSKAIVPLSTLKLNAAYLGLVFAALFTAVNTVQALMTTLFPGIGFVALAVMYLATAVGAIIAPTVGETVGEVYAMMIAAASYVLLMLTVASGSSFTLLLGCVISGIGGAILWVNQGIWLIRLAETGGMEGMAAVGALTGTLFTIFNLNSIFGNLIVIVVEKAGLSPTMLIGIMCGVAMFSCTMFMKVKHHAGQMPSGLTFQDRVEQIRSISDYRPIKFLSPYMLINGIGVSFTYATFPTLLLNATLSDIAAMFIIYGIASMVLASVWGKVGDTYGWKALCASHFVTVIVGFSVLIWVSVSTDSRHFAALIVCSIFLAAHDNLNNTMINIVIGAECSGARTGSAYVYFRIMFCVGFFFFSVISKYSPVWLRAVLVMLAMLVSIGLQYIYQTQKPTMIR